MFATEEGTSTDTKKGSSEPEQAFVCFARSTSGENLAKAAWRRSEREAPFSFLGLPLPGAAALGVGRILCKITRKRFDPSCHPEASQMLPRSDIPRIPGEDDFGLSHMPWARFLLQLQVGPSSARQSGQVTRGPGPWSPLRPDLGDGCTLALGSAAPLGRARSSAAPGAWENVRSWAGVGGCSPCFLLFRCECEPKPHPHLC